MGAFAKSKNPYNGRDKSPFVFSLAVICYALFMFYEMSEDVILHLSPQAVELDATVVHKTKGSITVRYEWEKQLYQSYIARGLLRFRFPMSGDQQKVLVDKLNPRRVVATPPIGSWFFWSTDLMIFIALFLYGVWTVKIWLKERKNSSA